jgi:conjugal transfer pilus assembly protein TraD
MSPAYVPPEGAEDPLAPLGALLTWIASSTLHVTLGIILGFGVAHLMRHRQLNWTWALVAFVGIWIARPLLGWLSLTLSVGTLCAARRGRRWRREDIEIGGDVAQIARSFLGPLDVARAFHTRITLRRLANQEASWFQGNELLIGEERDGHPVRVPLGGFTGGTHTLVVGATGSGKTVTMSWMAVRAIEHGMGTIVIDPKGDRDLRRHLHDAALGAGVPFCEWSPKGPSVYNPYARGGATEIADKLLAGERYSEPHYLRQAQRYLGQEVRLLREADREISLAEIVRYLDRGELEVLARGLSGKSVEAAQAYLASLTTRQQEGLSGVRDRLAIMAESDIGPWLDPQTAGAEQIDLLKAAEAHAVVYFNLEADRRPLLAEMLGAAIVQDLQVVVAELQGRPVPTLVVIDEFSAITPDRVARLFGRARSAGVSLVLGTQEVSDLQVPGLEMLLKQVMGNLSALIAHRQMVPDSATLLAEIAGTAGAWKANMSSDGRSTRSRGREYLFHPDDMKTMRAGHAAVIVPTGKHPVCDTRIYSLDD